MHDDFALFAVHDVRFFPREVVMVLDVEDHVRAELLGDVLVDERVVAGHRALAVEIADLRARRGG